MTRTQIQQLVVVLLLLLFVGVFLLNKKVPEPAGTAGGLTPKPGVAPETPAKPAEPPAPVPQPAAPDLGVPRDVFLLPSLLLQRLQQREQEEKELEQKRALEKNPKPAALSAEQAGLTNLELQGIFWGTAKPQAIINRKIVSVGDVVENAEVESISRDRVVLSVNGNKIELKPETFRSGGNNKEGQSNTWSSANPR